MHILTVVGARPQFIKLAPFSREARRRGHRETIVHTGQHYDEGMSGQFFTELGIAEPDYNLEVGSGTHGAMTARALEGLEEVMAREAPDVVVVFGDTNSTLAGALAAAKLAIPVAHVEAGLRSGVRTMPEEINRVLTDHCSDLLLAPNEEALANLSAEGLGGVVTGDIMVDALFGARKRAEAAETVLGRLALEPGPYFLLTLHRAANTDSAGRLGAIMSAFEGGPRLVFPAHPRTRAALGEHGVAVPEAVRVVEPLGYVETISLMGEAVAVITDSGGMQKEAYLVSRPCITLRDETEWNETVALGWNVLVGSDAGRIRAAMASPPTGSEHPPIFGDGMAASHILDELERRFEPGKAPSSPASMPTA